MAWGVGEKSEDSLDFSRSTLCFCHIQLIIIPPVVPPFSKGGHGGRSRPPYPLATHLVEFVLGVPSLRTIKRTQKTKISETIDLIIRWSGVRLKVDHKTFLNAMLKRSDFRKGVEDARRSSRWIYRERFSERWGR